MKNNQTTRRYLKLGGCYIAMDKTQGNQAEAIRVDHYCAGIEGFNIAGVHAYLQQNNIAYRDFPSGKDLAVTDPDGIRTQLADQRWLEPVDDRHGVSGIGSGGCGTGLPAHRLGSYFAERCRTPKSRRCSTRKSSEPVTQRNNNRIWFQAGKSRIGLLQTPSGQRPGVNHYCVAVEAFDYDAAVKKLEQAGAKVEAPEVAGAPEFRDRDGFLVQVKTERSEGADACKIAEWLFR